MTINDLDSHGLFFNFLDKENNLYIPFLSRELGDLSEFIFSPEVYHMS